MTGADILFCEDEEAVLEGYSQSLELEHLTVAGYRRASDLIGQLTPDTCAVVISDVRMPGIDGFELLATIQSIDRDLPVILITGNGDVPMALRALRRGAWDFLEKPVDPVMLAEVARRALAQRDVVLENRRLRSGAGRPDGWAERIIGRSPAAHRLRERLRRLSMLEVDVLLIGETGTGKEVAARALHDLGPRGGGPFVAINCGALPQTVLEAELFGHEPGAFTGASERRIGKIEHASGGTLFLDEIESMPLPSQVHLLRVLQERTVVRLGSNKELPVDIRVVTASKSPLAELAEAGAFRRDLAYRLDIARIEIPALRDRTEDIPALFAHFTDLAARRLGFAAPDFDASLLPQLLQHGWPGNIRELRNVAERFVLGLDDMLTDGDLPVMSPGGAGTLEAKLEAAERGIIRAALAEHNQRVGATAKALSISRKTLYLKMRKLGIQAAAGAGHGSDAP